jgi:D-3-phosphoglycerate dehydrogenase
MIGRRVAEFLAPFHCDVRVYDPYIDEAVVASYGAQKTDLEDMLRNSFVVSLHLGLTDETRGVLGEEELGWIPDNGLLVNTARAAVVDEGALVKELQSGRIRAALNVFWKEPLAPDHALRDLDNVILTPHGGGLTHDTMRRHSQSIVDDLERFFKGEQPQNVVTREMLPRMT